MNKFRGVLTYSWAVFKHLLKYPYVWAAFVGLSFAMGGMYGLLYRELFATGIAGGIVNTSGNSALNELIRVVPVLRVLGGTGVMQLNVFTGLTFFLSAFGVGIFLNHREKRCHWRLITMGYTSGQVFWGEGLAYFGINVLMVSAFHGVFSIIYTAYMPTNLAAIASLIGVMLIQSMLATGYVLMFLGLCRSQKTFSQFYFVPAFILSFLGGAIFPVDRIAGSGLYEWMPNYVLSTHYTALYEGRLFMDTHRWMQWGVMLGIALTLAGIGRWRFRLEEV